MATALLIIDVQLGMFNFRLPLHDGDAILARVAGLLARARVAGAPVFHVQHEHPPGDLLCRDAPGWPIHPAVAPRDGETVIGKRHSSAFHGTDLHTRLQQAGIDHLVVAGIQSEFCVDSTCRAAAALGYRVTLAQDAHSTFDTPGLTAAQIVAHENRTLGNGFAQLAPAAEVAF